MMARPAATSIPRVYTLTYFVSLNCLTAEDLIHYFMQHYNHELVLTPTECSTFYRVNVTGQRESLKYDFKFHAIHAIIRYSDYST